MFTLAVDGGPPRHTHTREDASIYLLPGLLEVESDGEEFEAAPGGFVFLPARGRTRSGASAAPPAGCSSSPPAGWRKYFDALHAALKTGDSSHVRAVQAEYGIRPS